jgi:hypothetical protein
MDQNEILAGKQFLGQEFLTWLWYSSETEQTIILQDGREATIMMGDVMVLGPAMGADGTRITVKGREFSLAEAREGLRRGKLLESLRFGLAMEEGDYWLTLKAADLGFTSVKLPPISSGGDEPMEQDAIMLERVHLLGLLMGAVEELFGRYLQGRLAAESGGELWSAVRDWAHS